jgi:hypothetical protein
MSKNSKLRALLVGIIVFSFGVGFGLVVARHHRLLGKNSDITRWERMDFIREAALWGFRHATLPAAERLVTAQLKSLENCENQAPTYPCKGKLPMEAFLMMAVLRAEAGDAHGKVSWIVRATRLCQTQAGAACSNELTERAVTKLAVTRLAAAANN